MGSPLVWTDVHRAINNGMVGDSRTWTAKIYDSLNEKGYIQFTAEVPNIEKFKEVIHYAINDFHEKLASRMVGTTLTMTIYNALETLGLFRK